ncbi:hypothetical protein [Deinococcus sp. QL22]|uniref:hypothetical protein n=1 Tax=Deinococcus sp. QL22 TaxID=2939437 RepID=UPI002017480B|nr:hypothetical protein [Deinococcus sp. QL22]UQN05762.1 hypothetical protein M1R55_12940 [Deinococcus sp. QL22]
MSNPLFSLHKTLIGKIGFAGLALTAVMPAQAQSAAPEPFRFQFPAGYVGRLGGIEGVLDFGADIDKVNAFGVRSFPLPTLQDVRVALVKHNKYWEYNISTRIKDTTLLAGIVNNGDSPAGIAKVEVTHDPFKGIQYGASIQGYQGNPYIARFNVGYASTVWQDRIRILNTVGIGAEPSNFVPYTFSQVNGGYGEPIGQQFNWRVDSTARLYTFPLNDKAQWSVDISPSLEYRPGAGVTLNLSHLERFAGGEVALPSLNLGRYEESNATITYRIPGTPEFGLGALRVRGTRNWTSDYTYLRNDVLLNIKALPFLIGPSIGYQWGPAKDGSTSQMLYALVVMSK